MNDVANDASGACLFALPLSRTTNGGAADRQRREKFAGLHAIALGKDCTNLKIKNLSVLHRAVGPGTADRPIHLCFGIEEVTLLDGVPRSAETFGHLLIPGGVHEDSRAGSANLSQIGEQPHRHPGTAASIAASDNTMCGVLPPSSRVTRLKPSGRFLGLAPNLGTAREAYFVDIRMARECYPGDLTRPVTTLNTSAGDPASSISFAMCRVVSGASSDGFITSVEPAASVGASFHAAIIVGAFDGVMAPMTPTGSGIVSIPALTLERGEA
jgi:hypothetical protein